VATQSLASRLEVGIFAKNMAELGMHLRNQRRMKQLRANIWRERLRFSFDDHADQLVEFFPSSDRKLSGQALFAPQRSPNAGRCNEGQR
jgi:hypothetical protein